LSARITSNFSFNLLHTQNGLNSQWPVALGLAAFFGLFTVTMTGSSTDFAVSNITTIENLNRKTKVWQLAVLIPSPQELARIRPPSTVQSAPAYRTVTYPLPIVSNPSEQVRSQPQSSADETNPSTRETTEAGLHTKRDAQATRTFAILSTEPGENPWDLGSAFENWKTVMGDNVLDWILPFKRSPCCNHEDGRSQFKLGPNVDLLLARHGFVFPSEVGKSNPRSRRAPRPATRSKHYPNQRNGKKIDMDDIHLDGPADR